MKKVAGAIGVAVLVAAVAAVLMKGPASTQGDGVKSAVRDNAGSSGGARGSLAPEAVLAIAPRRGTAPGATPTRAMPPALQQFHLARSYVPIYARLKSASARTPEEQWILAEILTRCARVADDDPSASSRRLGGPGMRERFFASIAPNDPNRDKRMAAFDAVNYDACAEIGEITATRKDIRALLEAGASGGDPKARAALVMQELEDQLRGPDGKQKTGPDSLPRISDAQLETLRQAMASGDPYAMRSAASLMMGRYDNMSLRDEDDRPVDTGAFFRAAVLASCDYGLPCGPDSAWVMNGCAFVGNCAANNLRDHMMFYNSSPNASQVMATYEVALRNATRDGNWSFFHFYPGPNPSTAAYQSPLGP
jgi:hypothetical protein